MPFYLPSTYKPPKEDPVEFPPIDEWLKPQPAWELPPYSGPSMSPATEAWQSPTTPGTLFDPNKINAWGTSTVTPFGLSQTPRNLLQAGGGFLQLPEEAMKQAGGAFSLGVQKMIPGESDVEKEALSAAYQGGNAADILKRAWEAQDLPSAPLQTEGYGSPQIGVKGAIENLPYFIPVERAAQLVKQGLIKADVLATKYVPKIVKGEQGFVRLGSGLSGDEAKYLNKLAGYERFSSGKSVAETMKAEGNLMERTLWESKLSQMPGRKVPPFEKWSSDLSKLEDKAYDLNAKISAFEDIGKDATVLKNQLKNVESRIDNLLKAEPSIGEIGAAKLGSEGGEEVVEQAAKKPITMAGVAPETPVTTFRKGKEYAGNLRLERFSEDVQDTLRNVVASDPDKLTEVGRGVRTWKQTEDKAREILQYVGGDENKLIKKIGQAYNAEEIEALSMATQRKFDEVLNLQKLIQGGANTDENLVKLALLQKEFESLSKNITFGLSGATSEAGRTLNILKKQIGKMESMSPDTQKWRNLIRQLGGRKGIEKFSDSLALLDINNKAQVANFLRTVNQLSWKKIQNYPSLLRIIVYNSMLSSPRTQLINLGSTMLHSGIAMTAEREAAALMEALLRGGAKITGRTVPEQQRFFGEGLAELMSLRNGIKQGTRDMIDTIRYGVSPEQLSKYEIRARLPGKVGRVLEIPSTGMAAGDAFFYGLGHTGALEAELYRLARRAGFNPLKNRRQFAEKMADLRLNPPESLLNNAAKEAERRLFRGEPGQATAAIMKAREKIPGSFLILPFIRTPAALIKRGAELSPLQILNPHLWKHLIKKSPEAADELAKLAIGTALTTSIYFYVRDGKITGPPPQNAAARDRFYREGKQPYSLKIGDKWLGYQPLEPLNLPLSMVAAVVNALDEGDDKTAGEKAWQAVDSMGRNILSQTYISGLGNVFDAIENPESQGGRVIARMLTSFIPFSSALRTTSQIVDPTVRDIEPWDIASSIKSQIPGLTGQVPARVDVFGDTPERQGAQWSPYRTSEVVDDPLTQELERLELNIGFVGDTIGGQKLDPEEQRQYQEMAGKAVEGALIQAMFKPSYASLPDLEKKRVLQRAADAAKADIRRQLEPIFAPAFAR